MVRLAGFEPATFGSGDPARAPSASICKRTCLPSYAYDYWLLIGYLFCPYIPQRTDLASQLPPYNPQGFITIFFSFSPVGAEFRWEVQDSIPCEISGKSEKRVRSQEAIAFLKAILRYLLHYIIIVDILLK
jgi:hypothetical protein